MPVHYRTRKVGAVDVFYREAGDPCAPTLLLLHGWPTSSHMFRRLIPLLEVDYHVIAPDLPGFGLTKTPPRAVFSYRFATLADTIDGFLHALGVQRVALYLFDYGGPVGFRLALRDPSRVGAIISQNANAYIEGFRVENWELIQRYWRDNSIENREACTAALAFEATKWEYLEGVPDPSLISPDAYLHDQAILDRPGSREIQLDLFRDYQSNLELFPEWQAYLRGYQPPLLAIWGKNDPFFAPEGALAYRRDVPNAEIHLLNTGHFALETHLEEIAGRMRDFLGRTYTA